MLKFARLVECAQHVGRHGAGAGAGADCTASGAAGLNFAVWSDLPAAWVWARRQRNPGRRRAHGTSGHRASTARIPPTVIVNRLKGGWGTGVLDTQNEIDLSLKAGFTAIFQPCLSGCHRQVRTRCIVGPYARLTRRVFAVTPLPWIAGVNRMAPRLNPRMASRRRSSP